MRRLVIGGAALLGLTACGGGMQGRLGSAFSTTWQNDGGKSIGALAERIAKAQLPVGRGLAVGVTTSGLVVIGLDGSAKWSRAGAVDARPAIAGDVVVATGGGRVFALDARTGKPFWSLSSDGRSLRGAGDDGRVTAVTLGGRGGGDSVVIAVDRSGRELLHLEAKPELGAPAVLADTVLVPWSGQYVSAVRLGSRDETARLVLRDKVTRVMQIGPHLYFGGMSLTRFDDRIDQAGANRATQAVLPARPLPGEPRLIDDGTRVSPPVANARDSIHLYARPAADGAHFAGDRYAATYYRIAMGLAVDSGALGWVRTLPAPVLGGDATEGGFALCDATGKVWLIGAEQGTDAGSVSLGEPVQSCVVSAGSFTIGGGKSLGSLAEQVERAVELDDAQMVTAQGFLLERLGSLSDPVVTKVLIDLASSTRTPPALAETAKKLLAGRRSGAEYMLEALGREYDFLSDVLRPPPVAPLADALAAMDRKDAAPLLARHLNDPADSPEDIEHAARALVKLASPAELEEIRSFFSLYRATAERPPLVAAVIAAAETLLRIGGAEGEKLVRSAAADPLTRPDVRVGLDGVLPPAKTTAAASAVD